jgi:hypothetical protein
MSPQNALNASQHRRQLREDKRRLRSAVFTMAVLVSSHLVCNSVHVTLTGRYSVSTHVPRCSVGDATFKVAVREWQWAREVHMV